MKLESITIGIMILIVGGTACTPSSGERPTRENTPLRSNTIVTSTKSIPETQSPATEIPSRTVAAETYDLSETPTGIAVLNETLMVNNEGTHPFLVDDQGRSLYISSNDTQNSNTSACIDDCAVEWPPLSVTGTPTAGPGVDSSLLGTISRDDGSTQATYNGWPLYYYILDTIPGTTFGQNYNGIWFLLSPTGEPIRR